MFAGLGGSQGGVPGVGVLASRPLILLSCCSVPPTRAQAVVRPRRENNRGWGPNKLVVACCCSQKQPAHVVTQPTTQTGLPPIVLGPPCMRPSAMAYGGVLRLADAISANYSWEHLGGEGASCLQGGCCRATAAYKLKRRKGCYCPGRRRTCWATGGSLRHISIGRLAICWHFCALELPDWRRAGPSGTRSFAWPRSIICRAKWSAR